MVDPYGPSLVKLPPNASSFRQINTEDTKKMTHLLKTKMIAAAERAAERAADSPVQAPAALVSQPAGKAISNATAAVTSKPALASSAVSPGQVQGLKQISAPAARPKLAMSAVSPGHVPAALAVTSEAIAGSSDASKRQVNNHGVMTSLHDYKYYLKTIDSKGAQVGVHICEGDSIKLPDWLKDCTVLPLCKISFLCYTLRIL